MCTYFKIETDVTQNLIDDFFEALYAELNERPEVVILQQTNFYNIFIPCLWLRIIGKSGQGV